MIQIHKTITAIAATGILAAALVIPTFAASTIVVTPTDTQGWSTADTRPGGDVDFVADATAPGGSGALQLTTDATTTSKAQYMHKAEADTKLSDVTELGYFTKQVSASFAEGAPSYQIPVYLNGTTGFTTLVFEPYQNPLQGPVVNNVWQEWDVDEGLFWSSRSVTCSNGAVVGTSGGPATYTLADIQTMCPEAVVLGYGVNIGSNNPLYNVETDLFNFNGTIYDFELVAPTPTPTLIPTATPTPSVRPPTSKDACKKDGYKNFTDANGQPFKNQGQCVSYSNHN
jgi:hypothetical protein